MKLHLTFDIVTHEADGRVAKPPIVVKPSALGAAAVDRERPSTDALPRDCR